MSSERIVRIVLPVSIIQSMDDLVASGAGGFGSRQEFVREAVEALVLELRYEEAPDPAAASASPSPSPSPNTGTTPFRSAVAGGSVPLGPGDIAPTLPIVAAPPDGPRIEIGAGLEEISGNPTYGLHNRDFPSLWAASRLGAWTGSGPMRQEEFYARIVDEAWAFGRRLVEEERRIGTRLSYLFPTNEAKPQSAVSGFVNFAVGTVNWKGGEFEADGPLFNWKVMHLDDGINGPVLGLTQPGAELLASLDGLAVHEPHSEAHARAFLNHILRYCPGDFWMFRTVLEAVVGRPARTDLIVHLGTLRSDWTEAQVTTNVAGYIARLREWGLVEKKQTEGTYRSTEFGEQIHRTWKETQ